jgi:hypothetical protein
MLSNQFQSLLVKGNKMSKLQNSYLVDNYGGHVSEIIIEKIKDSTNPFYGMQNLAEDEALRIHEKEIANDR